VPATPVADASLTRLIGEDFGLEIIGLVWPEAAPAGSIQTSSYPASDLFPVPPSVSLTVENKPCLTETQPNAAETNGHAYVSEGREYS
jgi:hypothetical protein